MNNAEKINNTELENTKINREIFLIFLVSFQIVMLILALVFYEDTALFLTLAFVVPPFIYNLKSTKIQHFREALKYALFLYIPLIAVGLILYLLSLLVAPIGLAFFPLLMSWFAWALVFIFCGFYLSNIIIFLLQKLSTQIVKFLMILKK